MMPRAPCGGGSRLRRLRSASPRFRTRCRRRVACRPSRVGVALSIGILRSLLSCRSVPAPSRGNELLVSRTWSRLRRGREMPLRGSTRLRLPSATGRSVARVVSVVYEYHGGDGVTVMSVSLSVFGNTEITRWCSDGRRWKRSGARLSCHKPVPSW